MPRSSVYVIACRFQLCPKGLTLQCSPFCLYLFPASSAAVALANRVAVRAIASGGSLVSLGSQILSGAACFSVGPGVHLSVGCIPAPLTRLITDSLYFPSSWRGLFSLHINMSPSSIWEGAWGGGGGSEGTQTLSSSLWLRADETRTPRAAQASPRHPGDFGPLFPKDYRIRGTGRPIPECNQPHSGRAGLHSAPVVSDWQRNGGQAHV